MPRKRPTSKQEEHSRTVSPEAFLRSINLQLDADHPERIAHFQPTSKTSPLLRSLLDSEGDRALFVVAPYGSGKSITASYLLQLVEGREEATATLTSVEERLKAVSPELAATAAQRRRVGTQGLTLALHGFNPAVPEAIRQAALLSMRRQKLGREARTIERMAASTGADVVAVLGMLAEKARNAGRDRILILWDEFGRHVESLIAAGRTTDLAEIQVLAEAVSRASDLPVHLGLFLHRDLLQYAGNLPQSIRAEWKKIEGRFRTIQYVDDSHEIYRLVGEIVSSRRNGGHLPAAKIREAAVRAKQVGLFSEIPQKELVAMLRASYPLEATTLYLLPRLSARVAQNERTLFSFLLSTDIETPVGPDRLYDYFSPEMRSDVAAGGTYRQWLETESALTKAEGASEAKSLKAACLLGMGLTGERSRTGRAALSMALAGYELEANTDKVLETLIARKLLLHRKHSDQLAVWHGTDIDLRGRLEEEKRRRRATFDLVDFLEREVRAPIWRPLEYNGKYCLRRYLAGDYRSADQMIKLLGQGGGEEKLPTGSDGKILYGVIGESSTLEDITALVRDELRQQRLLAALPRGPMALTDAALEVSCLLALKKDRELLSSDPMAEAELHQMLDDARNHLQGLVDRVIQPGPNGPRWFYMGKELAIEDSRTLRHKLSEIVEEIFPKTPRINNEMIVKDSPSAVLVNARKRLLLGILEREEEEGFGIEGNGPDASMMRTVLLQTGLFRPEERRQWASPDDLDGGLRAVWQELRDFLTKPSDKPKALAPLVERLREPPYGVRLGVLPILFGAALKAFPSARALLRASEYVEDILASHVEAIFISPADHALLVRDVGESERALLDGMYQLFEPNQSKTVSATDVIRRCFDALEAWKLELPPGALSSRRVSRRAQRFQGAIRGKSKNPISLLLETLPEVAGQPVEDPDKLLSELQTLKVELEGVEVSYRSEAERALRQALRLGLAKEHSLRKSAAHWARCFPEAFVEALPNAVAKGLVSRCQIGYETDQKLLESVASLLVGKRFDRWDDTIAAEFSSALRSVIHEIEDVAISIDARLLGGDEVVEGLAGLIQGRIESLVEQLSDLVGEDRARSVVLSYLRLDNKREYA